MNFIINLIKKIFGFAIQDQISEGSGKAAEKQEVATVAQAVVGAIDIDKLRNLAYAKIDDFAAQAKAIVDRFYDGDVKKAAQTIKDKAAALKAQDQLGITQLPDIKCIFDLAENADKIVADLYNQAVASIEHLADDAKARVQIAESEETINQIVEIASKVIDAESGKLMDLVNARLKI